MVTARVRRVFRRMLLVVMAMTLSVIQRVVPVAVFGVMVVMLCAVIAGPSLAACMVCGRLVAVLGAAPRTVYFFLLAFLLVA